MDRIKDFRLRYVRETLPEGKELVPPSHDDQHRTTTDYQLEDVADVFGYSRASDFTRLVSDDYKGKARCSPWWPPRNDRHFGIGDLRRPLVG